MLTSELIKPRLRMQGSTLRVEMVNEQDPSLQQTAQDLLCLFQQYSGQSQAAWEEAVRVYEGTRMDYVLIRGLTQSADGCCYLYASRPPSSASDTS